MHYFSQIGISNKRSYITEVSHFANTAGCQLAVKYECQVRVNCVSTTLAGPAGSRVAGQKLCNILELGEGGDLIGGGWLKKCQSFSHEMSV